MTVRKIDYPNTGGPKGDGQPNPRVESGAVQFGEDWPGLFLRGDNCMGLIMGIERALNPDDPMHKLGVMELKGLVETIREEVFVKPNKE
jgi:hypothetical protein